MVDINVVYERVLLLANKEQRGYITPDEFNSFANQAQLEIFESYFVKKAQAMGAEAMNDSDYSDPVQNIEEKLTFFDNTITIAARGAVDGNTYQPTSPNAYAYPNGFYRLGVVILDGREATEVGHRDATYINLSPLTAPTATQPVYTRHEGGVVVYPTSYTGAIDMIYERQPVVVNWGYRFPTAQEADMMEINIDEPFFLAVGSAGTPEDGATINFELHPSEEHELVYKILTLAGVAIKQSDIAQFGQSKDGQLQQTEA